MSSCNLPADFKAFQEEIFNAFEAKGNDQKLEELRIRAQEFLAAKNTDYREAYILLSASLKSRKLEVLDRAAELETVEFGRVVDLHQTAIKAAGVETTLIEGSCQTGEFAGLGLDEERLKLTQLNYDLEDLSRFNNFAQEEGESFNRSLASTNKSFSGPSHSPSEFLIGEPIPSAPLGLERHVTGNVSVGKETQEYVHHDNPQLTEVRVLTRDSLRENSHDECGFFATGRERFEVLDFLLKQGDLKDETGRKFRKDCNELMLGEVSRWLHELCLLGDWDKIPEGIRAEIQEEFRIYSEQLDSGSEEDAHSKLSKICRNWELVKAFIQDHYIKENSGINAMHEGRETGCLFDVIAHYFRTPIILWEDDLIDGKHQGNAKIRSIHRSKDDQGSEANSQTWHLILRKGHYNRFLPSLDLEKRANELRIDDREPCTYFRDHS